MTNEMNDLLQAVAAEWGQGSQEHNIARDVCKLANKEIEALQADKARLLRANHVLRLGLSGMVDSEDALKIADAMTRGDDIDWDQYPEATRKALVKPRVLFASLHNRVLTDAEIDQIIKERSDDRDTAR